jgi:hypothetical protein
VTWAAHEFATAALPRLRLNGARRRTKAFRITMSSAKRPFSWADRQHIVASMTKEEEFAARPEKTIADGQCQKSKRC